ncbi:MAG: transporter [Phycisphaerae bacterium]|nr:transporter [Phycisphaerae bacterium]
MKAKQIWAMCIAGTFCLCGFSGAKAEERPAHKITPQEVAEMLADPSATLTYLNASYRAYKDVGPNDDTNQELRLNGAGFLNLPNNTSILYRAFVPLYSTEFPFDDQGVGDALVSAYWVPNKGNFILGYGGALITPTASEDYFGTGKWSAGPTLVVAQKVPGKFTIGGLLTHVWSFAGDEDRDEVSLTTIQPVATFFLNKKGTSVSFMSETTHDWQADDDPWQVPVTAGLGQILPPIGKQFIGVAVAGTYYAERADYAPEWDIRLTASVVFP